ncbi:WD40 repeat domain-containing protein [Anabaena catenula]|uniref:WD40 repeat domain-containing protein n=1 Tax=Anabaena catenula TaxID=1296320 RepID=UPI0030D6D4F1
MEKIWSLFVSILSVNAIFQLYFRGDSTPVEAIALSVDQKIIASSSEDGTIRIWQLPE